MGLHNYLFSVRKLNNMGRWATEFMHQRNTVSEHSFFVAQVGQMLALIEEQHGNVINWGKLFKKLLNHDVIESLTGDIISTVKNKNDEIRNMVNLLEKEAAEETLFEHMDEPYKSIYRDLLFDGKDETLEGQILRAADEIDALMECVGEVKLNNLKPFVDKYYMILAKLNKNSLTSVKFFTKNILPEIIFECTALKPQ
ncbi:MAG TPA: HD domain-containing protein [Candidatus Deferrimicrobium sp.]|nr:HD domain-containing protein [Candidatus Deferrimicrobium sp.]